MYHSKVIACLAALLTLASLGGCSPEENKGAIVGPGEQVYTKNCKVCHAQGINGAPILGNTKMWGPRLARAEDISTLVQHASEGFGLMPAKGGNTQLTEKDITAAVNYMVAKATE